MENELKPQRKACLVVSVKVFRVHMYLEGDVDTLEDAEETYATFMVMAKDEGQAEVLVKEYIKKKTYSKVM